MVGVNLSPKQQDTSLDQVGNRSHSSGWGIRTTLSDQLWHYMNECIFSLVPLLGLQN